MDNNQINKDDYKIVNQDRVSCDGGELGHPKIFLSLTLDKEVICPYCSKIFIYKKSV